MLGVCGGYQLLGHGYALADAVIPGLGLVDVETIRSDGPRLIGNVAIEVELDGHDGAAPARGARGFENHAGRTVLGADAAARARLKGHGNTGKTGREGVRRDGVIGTYLHGPLLPKKPGSPTG